MKRTLIRSRRPSTATGSRTACFAHAATAGDVSLCHDVTPPRTSRPRTRRPAQGRLLRERRVDPQIVIGLLVDRRGFPEIGYFEGDQAETTTIGPIIEQFVRRHAWRRGRRRRDAVGQEPDRAGRGRTGVHRRPADHQGAHRPGPTSAARRRLHRRADHRHHHPQELPGSRRTTPPRRPNRSGIPQEHIASWRAAGLLRQRAARATTRCRPSRRTAPARSSRARRRLRPPGLSRPAATSESSTRTSLARARRLAGPRICHRHIPATCMDAPR